MEQDDVFPRRIRWLAIATGLSTAGLYCFLTPFAVLGPAMLILGALLEPRFPRQGKWIIWFWAFGWSMALVPLALVLFHNFPRDHEYMMLVLASLLIASTLLVLWLDEELIVDGIRRIRIWRSTPATVPRPVGRGTWIIAIFLNLWVGSGVVVLAGAYHDANDLYTVAMALVWVVIVLMIDITLITRTVKVRRSSRAGGPPVKSDHAVT
jgi:hypothetical protein